MTAQGIPRILYCRWAPPVPGEHPSWLRQQTIHSFKRWNPGWHVEFERAARNSAHPAFDSDLYRWRSLYRTGGVWCDLDVIWYEPFETLLEGDGSLWLTHDGNNIDQPWSIGCVAARAGSPALLDIIRASESLRDADALGDYQAAGARLLMHLWGTSPPPGVGLIPHRSLYPRYVLHAWIERMWIPPALELPSHGLHWYAGHPTSARRQFDSPEVLQRARHSIGKALRWSDGKLR